MEETTKAVEEVTAATADPADGQWACQVGKLDKIGGVEGDSTMA